MKDSSITTFDPVKLKSKLSAAGRLQFDSYLASAHEVFHINRIEDYNNIVSLPSEWDAQPFSLTVFSFFFLAKGSSTRSKGLITYEFGANNFFFLPAYEISTYNLVNEGAEGFFCYFSQELFTSYFKLNDLLAEFPFLNFNSYPLVIVSSQMKDEVVVPVLLRLEKEYKKGNKCRYDILRTYLVTLFTELKPFVVAASASSKNPAYQITEQYKKALSQFIYEKQKVADYADMLAVSPNHLNKCVKNVTGKSAHDLLSEMILLEAKVLLKQTSLSVSEVAFQVGRNEVSDFVRFFKSKAGLSPGEYRKMVNPEL